MLVVQEISSTNQLHETHIPKREVLDVAVTGIMVARVMSTNKMPSPTASDCSLLYMLYSDLEKEMDLSTIYGSEGSIAEFVADAKIKCCKVPESRLLSIFLNFSKPLFLEVVTVKYENGEELQLKDFSKPFARILARLK